MLALTGRPSTVVLLVVDDAPEAASLRAEMVTVLRQSLARELERWEAGWWRPVDWSIVVAFPSAEGSARWYGPADDIALRLVASDVDDDAIAATFDALASVTPPGSATSHYRPLATARDGIDLLRAVRPPADERERALLASLPVLDDEDGVALVIASERDDASEGAVESYALPEDPPWVQATVIFASDDDSCLAPTPGQGDRLAAWGGGNWSASRFGYPCGLAKLTVDGVLPHCCDSGPVILCASQPLARRESGAAACEVVVRSREVDVPCDATRGWSDADPLFGEDFAGRYRRCAMASVPDEDLATCTHDPLCPGCASGHCPDERPASIDHCRYRGGHPTLRFVGGAVAGFGGALEIRCRLEP
ncbi:MAG: hypothetical protein R3B72_39635 [Polyangiaceae bacterium]